MGDNLDDLVFIFRSRDIDPKKSEEAAQILIAKFQNLAAKYVRLFLTGAFNPKDQRLILFLSLCKATTRTSNPQSTAQALRQGLGGVTKDELVHVCDVAILATASKYRHISSNYHFSVFELIEPMLSYTVTLPLDLESPKAIDDVPIDADWVEGKTCGALFCELTKSERQIIKLVWAQKLPRTQICGMLGLSPTMLGEMKTEIATKLWKMVKTN